MDLDVTLRCGALFAFAVLASACGSSGSSDRGTACEYDSTFDAIQAQIFDAKVAPIQPVTARRTTPRVDSTCVRASRSRISFESTDRPVRSRWSFQGIRSAVFSI
jgi:hypothetical protein